MLTIPMPPYLVANERHSIRDGSDRRWDWEPYCWTTSRQLSRAFEDLTATDTLILLGRAPSPARAAKPTRGQVVSALRAARRHHADVKGRCPARGAPHTWNASTSHPPGPPMRRSSSGRSCHLGAERADRPVAGGVVDDESERQSGYGSSGANRYTWPTGQMGFPIGTSTRSLGRSFGARSCRGQHR